MLKKLLNKKGQGVVMGGVTIAILIIIGLYVFATVADSIDTTGFSDYNDTNCTVEIGDRPCSDYGATNFNVMKTNTESGLKLGSILPLVIFAGAVIGALTLSKIRD